jgi:hypothetical protein
VGEASRLERFQKDQSMRKLFLTISATAAVLAAGVFATPSNAMTIGNGFQADTAGIEQVQYYGGYGYGGYGYRSYDGYNRGYRSYDRGYRSYRNYDSYNRGYRGYGYRSYDGYNRGYRSYY